MRFSCLWILRPAAFIQGQFRVDQVAVVFEQPVDAVVRAAAFFISSERDDDVAVGLESFLLILDKVGDPHRGLGFIVAGAAPVKKAILLDELKWIRAPVFALGFDNVDMCEEKNRLARAGAMITNDKVALFRNGAAGENVGVGKSCGF